MPRQARDKREESRKRNERGRFVWLRNSTVNAPLGTLGSKLPPRPTGTVWAAGSTVEVGFTVKASHGAAKNDARFCSVFSFGTRSFAKTGSGQTVRKQDLRQKEASFFVSAGGGYSYRLCPANETLDEKCFQRTPLCGRNHRLPLAIDAIS